MECLSNKLTPFNSKIHYKEENYLKVKTELLIYPSSPYSKGLSTLVYQYISISRSYILAYSRTELHYVTWLPLVL